MVDKEYNNLKYKKKYYSFKKNELQDDYLYFRFYDKGRYRVYDEVRYTGKIQVPISKTQTEVKYCYVTREKKYLISEKDHDQFLREFVKGEKAYKFYKTNIKFYSFPRNRLGSIIQDFRSIRLQDAVKMDSTTLHEYWPYLVPFDDDILASVGVDFTAYQFNDSIIDQKNNNEFHGDYDL